MNLTNSRREGVSGRRGTGVARTAVCVVLLVLAACGGSDSASKSSDGSESAPTKLKVGVIPITNYAPLYMAIEKGYFAEENLEVETVPTAGGAAIVPAMLAGDQHVIAIDIATLYNASAQGLPVRVAAPGTYASSDVSDPPIAPVLVPGDSPITTAQDLEGKTIAVNALRSLGEVTIRAMMAKEGADPDKAEFVAIGFPEMLGALDKGQVDAVWVTDPFASIGKEQGARVVLDLFAGLEPGIAISTWATSEQYYAQNKDVVERFSRAIKKANAYCEANPDEVRDLAVKVLGIDPKIAPEMALGNWPETVGDGAAIQKMADFAQEYGTIGERVDIGPLLLPTA